MLIDRVRKLLRNRESERVFVEGYCAGLRYGIMLTEPREPFDPAQSGVMVIRHRLHEQLTKMERAMGV